MIKVFAVLLRVLASLVGVCLWSISSIPNMIVSAVAIFAAMTLWSSAESTIEQQINSTQKLLNPIFDVVAGLQNLGKLSKDGKLPKDGDMPVELSTELIKLFEMYASAHANVTNTTNIFDCAKETFRNFYRSPLDVGGSQNGTFYSTDDN